MEDSQQLQITDPAGEVSFHALGEDDVSIGRAVDNGLTIPSYALSRHHAVISRDAEGGFAVTDLGSKNGVYRNGERIPAKERVPFGRQDSLDICGFMLRVIDESDRGAPQFTDEDGRPLSTSLTIDVLGVNEIRSRILQPTAAGTRPTPTDEIPMAEILTAAVDLIDTRDLQQVRGRVLDFVCRIVGFDAGYLLSWDPEAEEVTVDASRTILESGKKPAISRSVIRDVAVTRKPVLLLDAQSDQRYEGAVSIVGLGISSAIAAPMLADDNELLSVIYITRLGNGPRFTESDAHVLAYVAAVAALRFQNARLTEEALRTRFLEGELSVAAKIQSDLLPQAPPNVPSFDICEGYTPCRIASGDFYDFVPLHDGRIAIALGDVSGKGVGAAMLMFSAVTVLRTLFTELSEGRDFGGLVTRANSTLASTLVDGRFATAFAGCLDPVRGLLVYSNAAQSGVVVRADGQRESLDYHGTPLGLFEDAIYAESRLELGQGDILCLYTDGVSEARSEDQSFFGDGRVADLIASRHDSSAREIASALKEDLARFVGDADPADDITFVILKRI